MDYVRRVDVERLVAESEARLRGIEADVWVRINARISAGEDPTTVAAEESHRAVAQVDAVHAEVERKLKALPTYPDVAPE